MDGSRIFVASNGHPCAAPLQPREMDQANSDGILPIVYLDASLHPYDKYYRLVTRQFDTLPNTTIKNPFTHESIAAFFSIDRYIDLTLPSPQSFDSYEQFFRAICEWELRVRTFTASALLPAPILSYFYFPIPPKIFTKEELSQPTPYRTFKATLWPLLPSNYLKMIEILYSAPHIKPEEPFPVQIPKRETICMRHHITSDKQWESQMIPREPIPALYDTYEEFEIAYKRWCGITLKETAAPLISPASFEEILNINFAQQPALDQKPHEKTSTYPTLPHFSPPKDYERLSRNLKRLSAFRIMHECPLFNPDLITKEMNPDLYIQEMLDFGIDKICESCERTIRNYVFFRGFGESQSRALLGFLGNSSDFDLQRLCQLLTIHFSANSSPLLMRADILSGVLIPKVLDKLITFASASEAMQVNLSYLLQALLSSEGSNHFVLFLLNSSNLYTFDKVVRLVAMTSKKFVTVIPPIRCQGISNTINRLYLLSVLMDVADDVSLACKLSSYVESLLLDVKAACSTTHYLDDVRSLNSDFFQIAQMIFDSNLKDLQRIFFIDFTDFLNQISSAERGSRFLLSVSYSKAATNLARSLANCMSSGQIGQVFGLLPSASNFIRVLLKLISSEYEQSYILLTAASIMCLFSSILRSDDTTVLSLLSPVVTIAKNPKIIADFDSQIHKDNLLSMAKGLSCSIASCEEKNYLVQLRALNALCDRQEFYEPMASNGQFLSRLSKHWFDTEIRYIIDSWKPVNRMSKFECFIIAILNEPNVGFAMTAAIHSSCNISLHYALQLYSRILDLSLKTDNIYPKLLMPSIAQIVYLYSERFQIFKRFPILRKHINQIFSSLTQCDPNKMPELYACFGSASRTQMG